ICAHDANLGGTPASFGCRIENEAGTKLSSFKPQATDIVAVALDRTLAAQAITDPNSFWHWSFAYPDVDPAGYTVKFVATLPGLVNANTKVLASHPGQSSSPAPAPTSSTSHTVFLSSSTFRVGTGPAQFNSLVAADARCNELAQNARLPGSFRAILSDATQTARDRIRLQGPIRLTDGDLIANINVFWSLSHSKPIIRDEFANSIGGGTAKVWSGTLESGLTAADEHCTNWSDGSSTGKARYGLGDQSETWISDGQEACDQSLRLYCISL
ncbi:MAG TPA: hypothetical protein VE954_15480, partial [Oligoflexus sp.]|uniref:hypothetical protein n=1 Tax=Oligoflexus sp. TaxID=1971216 RepID=UPI002D669E7F